MAADQVQRQPGRQFGLAVVKADPAGIDLAHEPDHVLDVVGVAQRPMAHAAPGGVGRLGVLHMEGGGGEVAQRARVVVVQVGEDHVAHLCRVDADEGQALRRAHQQLAAALARRVFGEAGVHHIDPSPRRSAHTG